MPITRFHPPQISPGILEDYVRENFGMRGRLQRLVGDISSNYLFTETNGHKYVLKIAHQQESLHSLEAQNRVLLYLAGQDLSFRLPQPLADQQGRYLGIITDEQGNSYPVRMLTYLEGRFLADVPRPSDQLLFDLGRCLAAMDLALEGCSVPGVERYWHWDLQNLADLRDYLGKIPDASKRNLADYFILQFETHVRPHLHHLRKSTIHNDANDHNILVDETSSGQWHLCGLIDFGDMVYSCTVFELAVALTYVMFGKADSLAAALPVISGYHQMRALTAEEVDLLYYLIAARACNSVIVSAFQQDLRPDEPYLSVSETDAWALLYRWFEMNPQRARREFRRACDLPEYDGPYLPVADILKDRQEHIAPSLSISYSSPLHIVRAGGAYLFDADGHTYLDCVNNVCHVGHCHPHVVRAAQRQMALLNTNTRYLYEELAGYARRLCATLPAPLSVCYFVNSGSEANELALRLARTYTGNKDIIVLDHAYHGNTGRVIDISPYKFNGPGGRGCPKETHIAELPDTYRGRYRKNDPQAGAKYARSVQEQLDQIHQKGRKPAGFIFESIPGCAGQIVLPENYLRHACDIVHRDGALCIADEVQVGFGRVGSHFWAFESQGIVPDIITMGKPIGNGHPLAAVVTTAEIARAFANGMEYFNTFGGNPVSCAVGMAVLDVIEQEQLQQNALHTGRLLLHGLNALKKKFELIGDVRGLGLFIGIELVTDRRTLQPAARQAIQIIERMKERGILLSIDGPLYNVLKIKPPVVFNEANAVRLVETLDEVLATIKPYKNGKNS